MKEQSFLLFPDCTTPLDLFYAHRSYCTGKPLEVVKQHYVTNKQPHLYQRVHDSLLNYKPPKLKPDKSIIKQLYDQGLTKHQIADESGWSYNTVRAYLKELEDG